jgi:hypothetical protein
MSKQTMSAISIIPLSFGSILMLAAGTGLISTKYPLVAGLVCFVVFVFIEAVSRKKISLKSDQLWKLRKNTKHE